LSRTPYNAAKRTARNESTHMLSLLPQGDDVFVEGGYIWVVQDTRGMYGSEGDYWFHYGAFRQMNLDYFARQTTKRAEGDAVVRGNYDDYEAFRSAGSAGRWARLHGPDLLPWAQKVMEHGSYDSFWQGQALDKIMADHPSPVPTMWVQGLCDQEDMWCAIHSYLALKKKGQANYNYLVMGPWNQCQCDRDGDNLGPLRWEGDTALQFRRDVLRRSSTNT
jgi:predicted acyl esterase